MNTAHVGEIRNEAGGDDLECRRERADTAAVACRVDDGIGQAAEDQHARQRHDEGGNAVIGDEIAMPGTDRGAHQETNHRRERQVHVHLHDEHTSDRPDESDDRTDGQIDMAGDNDQQHAKRHDDDERVLQHDVGQVLRPEENTVRQILKQQHDDDERDQHAVFADVVADMVADGNDVAAFRGWVGRTH